MMSRRIAALMLLQVSWAGFVSAQAALPEVVHLNLQVFDQAGRPLDKVTANVQGGSTKQLLHGDLLGRLGLDLPVGTYSITFSRPHYYDLELRELRIEIPEPDLRKERFRQLRLMMLPRPAPGLSPRAPPPPRQVDASALSVAFHPTKPPVESIRAVGNVAFTNTGTEPLLLPQGRDLSWVPHRTLVLWIHFEIEGMPELAQQTLACEPPKDCHELAPGESIEIPVELGRLLPDSLGQAIPVPWGTSGEVEGTVAAWLVLPHGAAEPPIVTRRVESTFRLTVKGWQ